MSIKRVKTRQESIRTAYVQRNFIGSGIGLEDLRQLVAATADFHPSSHVKMEGHRIEVVEHRGAYDWRQTDGS